MDKQLRSDIMQWDIAAWSTALEFWEKQVDWSTVKTALELGGRQGGLSLWLALKGIDVVCSDLKETAETAATLHRNHRYTGVITYRDIDATQIPYENHFDLIVFKSILGGIGYNNRHDRQQEVFKQIYKALKPGGILLFAENLSATYAHSFLRKVFTRWGAAWRYITVSEMKAFLKEYSRSEIHTTGFLSAFGRSEAQRTILTSLDKGFVNMITPGSWKYIVYGIAVK